MYDTFVIFGSELDCDRCNERLNLVYPALKFTVEKEQNNSLNFLDASVEKQGTGFLKRVYSKLTLSGQYIRSNSFCPKARKISLITTLVHRALMICSKTKLSSELDRMKQLLIENGYPEDVLLFCIKQKLANFATEKPGIGLSFRDYFQLTEHSIRTRNSSNLIRLPVIKTEYARKSFSFTGAKEYNILPLEAREMATTDFTTFLKKHFS